MGTARHHRPPQALLAILGAGLSLIVPLLLLGCQGPPPAPQPSVRAAPRHPIQPPAPQRSPAAPSSTADSPRLNFGPNTRISPTPDMAPRIGPTVQPTLPSTQPEIDALRQDLRQQRKKPPYTPGPPVGIIDERPGTIHPESGIIQVPN